MTESWDVIVVGSGAGGLTVATVAAKHGLDVLVIEKTRFYGGTTAYSGGVAWIPDNRFMKQLGIADSRDNALTYLRETLGNHYEPAKIESFVDNAPEMMRFMEQNTAVEFVTAATPDYDPDKPGASRHRGVLAKEFDGRRLGPALAELRLPVRELTILGTLQIAGADIVPFRTAFRSAKGFVHTARILCDHAMQRLRSGRGTRLVSGNALAGRLLRSALDAGVALRKDTAALRPILDAGRVVGLAVACGGTKTDLAARHAVVLASGGFGSNEAMRRAHMPLADHHVTLQPSGNVGDGIRIGVEAGGRLVEDNPANGILAPVSVHRRADGRLAKFPHIMIDRYMPGSLAVDPSGRRFVNEADSYHRFVQAMQRNGFDKVYMIADHRFLRRYGMGLVRPFPYPIGAWLRNRYLARGRTLRELAARIGVDPAELDRTVAAFNAHAREGRDPDFRRGEDAHSRFRGDQDNRPNPSLAPLATPPFYAIALHPGDLSTVAGLATDASARVLGRNDEPIPGLYAVGLDMNSVTRGLYPAGGSALGPAMTFAYVAARSIAAKAGILRAAA